jgi:hypothetical protein
MFDIWSTEWPVSVQFVAICSCHLGLAATGRGVIALNNLIVLIIVGAIAGWLSGQIVKALGFGLIGNIIIIVGIVVDSSAAGSLALSKS